MFLGIEIGGTKLQLGVGSADSTSLVLLERFDVDRAQGAAGILDQIVAAGSRIVETHPAIERVGVAFGGPVLNGRAITSHHVCGWDGFDFPQWSKDHFELPLDVDNDCNAAALAESVFGAGRTARRCFYVTVGTGIGGGLVCDKVIYGNDRPGIAEIGHMRPDRQSVLETQTVESISSGSGIENEFALRVGEHQRVSAKQIAELAANGNADARGVMENAARTLGWAIAQTVTLTAPEVVIIGGGVSLIGDAFFDSVRESFDTYVFGPLRRVTEIKPAQLGEDVAVHGALLLAKHGRETSLDQHSGDGD